MKSPLKKFVLHANPGKKAGNDSLLAKRRENIRDIWHNKHQDDVGVEKLLRLFLAASQFLFPGLYIKHFFGKNKDGVKELMMDIYIILKVLFPFSLLLFDWLQHSWAIVLLIYLLMETLLYVPTLIFASDLFARPTSYRRSMLLLFINYFEIVFVYSYIYAHGNYLNIGFNNWYDPIYYSFTTLSTIGYGDYYPVTGMGKFLVCTQSLVFVSFVMLFLNFFTSKSEHKGYFGKE